ncbi:hypothetical protein AAGR90_000910, partial [Campylobacter coli]
FFLLYFKDKIPKDSLIFLKESLEKASEEQKEKLLFIKLKNPLYGLLFAFLLPGLDRIYNGNIILGILKIISAILVSIGLIIAEDKNDESCRRKNKISIWKNKTSIKVEILFFYKA